MSLVVQYSPQNPYKIGLSETEEILSLLHTISSK
mgnify:CR=1 FL=1